MPLGSLQQGALDYSDRVDLQTVFQHPAGLRTARQIVASIVRNTGSRPGTGLPSTVAPSMGESSANAVQQLEELLAFSMPTTDSGRQPAVMDGFFNSGPLGRGYPDFMSSSMEQQSHTGTSQRMQQLTGLGYEHPAVFHPHPRPLAMNQSYRPVSEGLSVPRVHNRLHPRQSPSPLSFERLGSPMPGIDSPYRVESPSGHLNRQTQRSLKSSGSVLLETDPYQLDRFPQNSTLSGTSIRPQSSGMRTFSQRQMGSGLDIIQSPYSNGSECGVQPHTDLLTIKNFLPVNKGGNRITADNTKQNSKPLRETSAMDRIISRPSPPALAIANSSHFSKFRSMPNPSDKQRKESSAEGIVSSKKRKDITGDAATPKKQRSGLKKLKKTSAGKNGLRRKNVFVGQFPIDLWMRILEFSAPSFLKKARLISKDIKILVDDYDSILVNQRLENYGAGMPGPPPHLSERQFNDLLGGKGCMETGCTDKLSSRAHWSWYKRWCTPCWVKKVQREDKVIKALQNQYGRNTVLQMLESISSGMHDSFEKPHTSIEDGQEQDRPSTAPRLYRCYLQADVDGIVAKYDALTPAPYIENPMHTAAEKAAALAAHQAEMQALDQKRVNFFEARKKANDEHMAKVRKIEECVRRRRELNGEPNEKNRQARRLLFTQRAQEELPHIPTAFVQQTVCYKAATRIFRDGGTERGWNTLRPKIEKAWADSNQSKANEDDVEAEQQSELSRSTSAEGDMDFIRMQQHVTEASRTSSPISYSHHGIGGFGHPASLMRESNSFSGSSQPHFTQQNNTLPPFSQYIGQMNFHHTPEQSLAAHPGAYHASSPLSQQASRPAALQLSFLLNNSPSGPSINSPRNLVTHPFKQPNFNISNQM